MVAGTHSGVGKTTVATGLMAALADLGHTVSSAKVGPDFIDPGYHSMATGRPGHNLDAWICGADAIVPLTAAAASGTDLLVVEGVMGLFDGASWLPPPDRATDASGAMSNSPGLRDIAGQPSTLGQPGRGSTADVAIALDAPVVLVVDASSMSASVAALVHGYASHRPAVRLAGVILNRVGSPTHEVLLREALAPLADRGIPVLGALHRDPAFEWRDRHLGLVPVVEQPSAVRSAIGRLATAVRAGVDLGAIVALAGTAAPVPPGGIGSLPRTRRMTPSRRTVRVAVAGGRAFSFAYPDNLRRLSEAGAELLPFDPLTATGLPPDVVALYAGGGFPEVHAEALAANRPLLAEVRRRVGDGMVTWAECGGMLWLARSLDGHELCGAIDARGRMSERLALGYRSAIATVDSPIAAAGTTLRGHEFHYSNIDPTGSALHLTGRFDSRSDGFASQTLLASYLHLHLGADPAPAERFVATALAAVQRGTHGPRQPPPVEFEPSKAPPAQGTHTRPVA